jgi:hypothetical protein
MSQNFGTMFKYFEPCPNWPFFIVEKVLKIKHSKWGLIPNL